MRKKKAVLEGVDSSNSVDMRGLDVLRKIASENPNYSLDEVNDRFFEITGESLSRSELSLNWNTILAVNNTLQKSSEELDEESIENIEDTIDNQKEKVMIEESVSENNMSLSEALRSIFSKNLELSTAEVKEKCEKLTGKVPSNPLIFQIKAKMKQGNKIKAKVKKVNLARKKIKNSVAVTAKNNNNIIEFTNILKKVKSLIGDFDGKENLIEFLTSL